jgi:glucuronate isomerase
MKTFITENFLLQNKTAIKLYNDYAKNLPIIDYHCHLPPDELAKNKKFENISKIWLNGDHYKWRAMRTLGVSEKFITGEANDYDKFMEWSKVIPYTIRNPLYHWSHLELLRYFDVDELLNEKSAQQVYHVTSEKLQNDAFSTQGLLKKMNVEVVCTTDDPIDSLKHHSTLKDKSRIFPTFRPDKALFIANENYISYIQKLAEKAGFSVNSYSDLLQALQNRIDFFYENGCKLSDHGLEKIQYFDISKYNVETIFKKRLNAESISSEEVQYFEFYTLFELCKMYHAKNWTIQFHLGALRNNNERMLHILGADSGFDSIGDFSQARSLSSFLNLLDKEDKLCKTIIYNLNPSDNEVFASMIGNFNDGSIKGKVQFGAAWWFLDQKDGMEKQINTLSNLGVLSASVGMLTDSRSFLSFPRHEYFRRLLCNMFGKDIENGLLPNDEILIGEIISNICYYNAKNYFNF